MLFELEIGFMALSKTITFFLKTQKCPHQENEGHLKKMKALYTADEEKKGWKKKSNNDNKDC